MTNIYRNSRTPAIDSMRTRSLEAPLDLEALGSSVHSLLVNPALTSPIWEAQDCQPTLTANVVARYKYNYVNNHAYVLLQSSTRLEPGRI